MVVQHPCMAAAGRAGPGPIAAVAVLLVNVSAKIFYIMALITLVLCIGLLLTFRDQHFVQCVEIVAEIQKILQDRIGNVRQVVPVRRLAEREFAFFLDRITLQLCIFSDSRMLAQPVRQDDLKLAQNVRRCQTFLIFLRGSALCGESFQKLTRLTGQRVDKRDEFKGTHAFWHKQNAAVQLHH